MGLIIIIIKFKESKILYSDRTFFFVWVANSICMLVKSHHYCRGKLVDYFELEDPVGRTPASLTFGVPQIEWELRLVLSELDGSLIVF